MQVPYPLPLQESTPAYRYPAPAKAVQPRRVGTVCKAKHIVVNLYIVVLTPRMTAAELKIHRKAIKTRRRAGRQGLPLYDVSAVDAKGVGLGFKIHV